MIQLHIWPVVALAFLIALNIVVILMQKDDRKLKKYLRIQATAWTTLMSMILFTGAAVMAYLHIGFSVKIILMIVAAVALSSLEIRRHYLIKRSRPGNECFSDARKKVLRYYIFQLLWILMIGGFVPQLP
ncbi:hypothetical protein HCR_10890 [Hydrogenimonas cancrithermarum]|uniref:Uncharacterized protein n=2 Tax=Hydrogenimonas cancrithermarum TaxID=2993563 RepID=A0ABM8FKE4_9BACT|nr:hypothetical protein HCR_10890 [Hydrogenimonas cancrithermarum]